LAGSGHLAHDVRPPDELSLVEELRDRRPVVVDLDAFAHVGIREHVHRVKLDADPLQGLDDPRRESALGERGGALHEQHGLVAFESVLNPLPERLRKIALRHIDDSWLPRAAVSMSARWATENAC